MAFCIEFAMQFLLVFVGLLGRAAAFAPRPIRWGGRLAERYVVSPAFSPSNDKALPQKLTIRDHPRIGTSSDAVPYFTVNADNSITWDAKGWCIEASGPQSGAAVNINHCSGGPAQKWNLLQGGSIQLKGFNQCLDVDDKKGDLNGAPIRLRECENQATEAWELESVSPATQGPAQGLLPSFSIRHVMMCFIMVAALLSLGAPVLRMLQRSRTVVHQVPAVLDQGGVCMTSHLTRLPAVMTISPRQINTIDPTIRENGEIKEKKDALISAEVDHEPPVVAAMPIAANFDDYWKSNGVGLSERPLLADSLFAENSKAFVEWFLLPVGLMVSLIVRTFALKTLSADPSVNIVLSLRTFEELVTSFFGGKAADEEQGAAEAGEAVSATAVTPLPEWFAWDLTQLAAFLRVVNGVATVKALEVAPMPVFGVVCSLEPGIAFLILLAFDHFTGRGTHQEARAGGTKMGMQELGLMLVIGGAALAKFGDFSTEPYVYGLCALKAVLSAGEDTMQDEARIETGLPSQQYVPALYKRVLPMSAVAALYFEILPAFQQGQTLIPSDPSPMLISLVLLLPVLGYVAEWLWFEFNRVSGDPVITMSMQPPKDALASFLIPGSFDHLSSVAMVGYVMNLLGVGVYAGNSARGKERREETETDMETSS